MCHCRKILIVITVRRGAFDFYAANKECTRQAQQREAVSRQGAAQTILFLYAVEKGRFLYADLPCP